MRKQLFFISMIVLVQTANCLLPTISNAQKIAGGWLHSLAVCADGTAWAWGYNLLGQLGNGGGGDLDSISYVPTQVISLTEITAIAAGSYHSLALKSDSTVWAWGWNAYGQLGNGTNSISYIPVQVSSLTGITTIAGGGNPGQGHSLALKNDGTVWAWGSGMYGQLGDGTGDDSNVPVQVSSLTGVTAIAAGISHSMALKNDSTVWSWGANANGQLGDGAINGSNVPVQVSSLTGIIAIDAGNYHSIALKNDGTVWAWGANGWGQLGNGNINGYINVPVQVSGLPDITTIAAGGSHCLALSNDSTVWAWGFNYYGQLGTVTIYWSNNVPLHQSSLTGITAIAGGENHSLFLKKDGTLWACGSGWHGELGDGTNNNSSEPVQVIELCQVATSVDDAFPPTAGLSMTTFIFPNPVQTQLTVNLATPANEVSIRVYDLQGRMIALPTTFINTQAQLNTTTLPDGFYTLQIINNKTGRSEVGKFVKQ